jgi:putative DNA primase/helicase
MGGRRLPQLSGGRAPPNAVLAATEAYLIEEDSFGRWVEECCVVGRDQWGIGDRLWGSWKAWAERNKEATGTRKAFAQTMEGQGYPPDKSQHVRGYRGIDLKPTGDDGDEPTGGFWWERDR